MYFICQDDKLSEEIEAITKAITLLCGDRGPNRINKRIQDLLHIADDMRPDSAEYQWVLERVLELLMIRDCLRQLRRIRSKGIGAELRSVWLRRIENSNRTSAGITIDPMSAMLPVPPTFEAAISFGCGRNQNVLPC